jgi:xanthine dehydrogenase large subunit
MLALSVREALREAISSFGPGKREVELASPATPEAVYWAISEARDAEAAMSATTAGTRQAASAVPISLPSH